MYFILFNGPPRSGKDTAALAAKKLFDGNPKLHPIWEKFSRPLKFAFAGMMNTPIDIYGNCKVYEPIKEQLIPSLGVSYRQWQIDFSEKFMKPLYGQDIFVSLLLQRQHKLLANPRFVCLISDCGFQVEADVLGQQYYNNPILLITIRREGCTFEGDSREWVQPVQNMKQITLHNNGSKEAFEAAVVETIEEWMNAQKPSP